MIGLHPPFRRATPDDRQAVDALGQGEGRITPPSHSELSLDGTVLGEENGRVFAVLSGHPAERGNTWHVDVLAFAGGRSFDEFGSRLLAVADALAADEGLAAVSLVVDAATDHVLAVLEREGFRADGQESATLSMSRPVVPQG